MWKVLVLMLLFSTNLYSAETFHLVTKQFFVKGSSGYIPEESPQKISEMLIVDIENRTIIITGNKTLKFTIIEIQDLGNDKLAFNLVDQKDETHVLVLERDYIVIASTKYMVKFKHV